MYNMFLKELNPEKLRKMKAEHSNVLKIQYEIVSIQDVSAY